MWVQEKMEALIVQEAKMNEAMAAMFTTYGEDSGDKNAGIIFRTLVDFVKMLKIQNKD